MMINTVQHYIVSAINTGDIKKIEKVKVVVNGQERINLVKVIHMLG